MAKAKTQTVYRFLGRHFRGKNVDHAYNRAVEFLRVKEERARKRKHKKV
jgi:hypothetical protein